MSPLQSYLSIPTSVLHLVVQPESSCCFWEIGKSKSINSEKVPKKQFGSQYPKLLHSIAACFSCKTLVRKEGACHW